MVAVCNTHSRLALTEGPMSYEREPTAPHLGGIKLKVALEQTTEDLSARQFGGFAKHIVILGFPENIRARVIRAGESDSRVVFATCS